MNRILRDAYNHGAKDRDTRSPPACQTVERDRFIELLRQEQKTSVLEVGAATGSDAVAFTARGCDVTCTDLSPQMVEHCLAKGLTAHVMDVAELRFPTGSFEAVYAMNCLVHVPKSLLPGVLSGISCVLEPDGVFYLGLYGGRAFEGIWDGDYYEPKRFFAHYPDQALYDAVVEFFDVHSFRCDPHGWDGLHFQSLILRNTTPVT